MSNPSPSNIIFSSRYKYFLNYANSPGSLTIPATTQSGAANKGSITIALDAADNFSQIQINFSTSSGNWYKFPLNDFTLDSNFTIATVGSRTGTTLTLTFYLVRSAGGSATSTAVTITANAYLFKTPS